MHDAALAYVNRFASSDPIDVLEFGSRDINGSPRRLWPNATWFGVDVVDGPGVDEVADAATWSGDPADVVVCCEVFEHTDCWREIVANMAAHTRPGGRVIVTAAGPDRLPHSAVDGGPLRDGEFYANVHPAELLEALSSAGLTQVDVVVNGGDVYGTGVRPVGKAKS